MIKEILSNSLYYSEQQIVEKYRGLFKSQDQLFDDAANNFVEQIVKLSVDNQVLSEFTAFVLVEEATKKEHKKETRHQEPEMEEDDM